MNPIARIAANITGWNVIGKGSLADQVTVDKDAQLEREHQEKLSDDESYREELRTKTIPTVDAIHKLTRPTLSFLSLVFGFVISMYAISKGMAEPALASAIGGPAIGTAYSAVKGRGNPTS